MLVKIKEILTKMYFVTLAFWCQKQGHLDFGRAQCWTVWYREKGIKLALVYFIATTYSRSLHVVYKEIKTLLEQNIFIRIVVGKANLD